MPINNVVAEYEDTYVNDRCYAFLIKKLHYNYKEHTNQM